MPKRGGRMKTWKSDNDHFEHDNRTNNPRRVSFKPGTNKGKNKFNSWKSAKLLFDDGDVDMGTSGVQGPRRLFRGRGGRLGSPVPRQHGLHKQRFIGGSLPWYQVIIPYGAKYDKAVVLRAILNHIAPEVFIPFYYQLNRNAAVFYVDDVKIAEKLFQAHRKIVMPDGFKLVLIVRNSIPNINLDAKMKEKMKEVMAKRYNPATKALDLTKFHGDPDLSEIFCALFRPVIMLAAIDIISENIPDIEALNLNDNKLHGLEHLKILSTKLKHLKILYLGDNKISHIGSLDPLKSLPLVELYLKGNPFLSFESDHDYYVREVRKRFPKLVRLDEVDLPPPIGFDVSDSVALPPRQQSFLVDPAGQGLVREFLTQYYAIFDSGSRHQLLEAYHDNSTMSMAVNYLTGDSRNSPSTRLTQYISNSRNIIRITERESRRRCLRSGKLQVVSFLSDLPNTTHDLIGFAVDLLIYTPTMIMLTMNGVFKETTTAGNPTRSFHRTFVLVPNNGGGYCIMNDMFYITNTTAQQEEISFNVATPKVEAQNPQVATLQAPVAPASFATDQQQLLLNTVGQQTGMNEQWSLDCLRESGWDLQRAIFIFNQLQSEGKIPHEAFVK